MREILFRGKRINNGELVEGFYNHIPCGRFGSDEHMIQTVLENGKIGMLYDIDPSTVGQYTGHTDKNGKRIFEGDIIRYIFDSPDDPTATENGLKVRTGRIFWSDWSSSFALTGGINGSASLNNVEVIGNIHDNPELLEVNRS